MPTPSDNFSIEDMEEGQTYKVAGDDCCLSVGFVAKFIKYDPSEDGTVEMDTAVFENGIVIGTLYGNWTCELVIE